MTVRYSDYDRFAWIYNRYWGGGFTRQVLPILEKLIFPNIPAEAHLIDVACGSGQLAGALTEKGYRVTGIDGSENLLVFARQNAPNAEFILADARSFAMPARFHAALCHYDSLNHIMTLPELTAV